jgi:hypothetical protein
VPDDVQSAVGKTLIKRSLRTKDKREAKRARQALDIKWEIEFDRCRSTAVSASSPQPLCEVSRVTHEDVVSRSALASMIRSSSLMLTLRP